MAMKEMLSIWKITADCAISGIDALDMINH